MHRPLLRPVVALLAVSALASCGGDKSSTPTGPAADFTVDASIGSTVQAGGAPASLSVTVKGTGGFVGLVTVNIAGVPDAASVQPVPPISVLTGTTQNFTIGIPRTTPARAYTLTVTGTSGSIVHSATATVTVATS